jgi:hypothetical protein
MELTTYLLASTGAIATVVFLIIRVKKIGVGAVIAKTVASLFFIATAAAATMAIESFVFGPLVLVGLVFGLVGDIFLDLKVTYKTDNDLWLFAGMASFTAGHIIYLLATLHVLPLPELNVSTLVAIPAVLALIFSIGVLAVAPYLKLQYGKFTLPAFVYAFLLSFWVFVTGSILIVSGFSVLWLMLFLGASFFLISDLILSIQYFGRAENANKPALVVTNHATYYLAQFLIACSILHAL